MSIDSLLSYNSWTDLTVNSMLTLKPPRVLVTPPIVCNVGATLAPSAKQIIDTACILFCGGGLSTQVSRVNIPSGASITSYLNQDIGEYTSFSLEFAVDPTPGLRTVFVPPDIVNVIPSLTETGWTNNPTPSTLTFQRGNIVLTFIWIPSILKWAIFGLS